MERMQSAIIYDCVCQAEGDTQMKKFINLAIVQATHPILFTVHMGHSQMVQFSNRQVLFSEISKLLKHRAVKMLESLKGTDVSGDIPVNPLLQEIDSELKLVSLNLIEVNSVKSCIKSTVSRLNSLVHKYQKLIDKYCQEYLIPIKLYADPILVYRLCAESEMLRFLNRRNNALRDYEKIRSNEDVEKLKQKRRALEEKKAELSKHITEAKSKLKQFRKCDSNLINEYLRVKELLDDQKWARSQLSLSD